MFVRRFWPTGCFTARLMAPPSPPTLSLLRKRNETKQWAAADRPDRTCEACSQPWISFPNTSNLNSLKLKFGQLAEKRQTSIAAEKRRGSGAFGEASPERTGVAEERVNYERGRLCCDEGGVRGRADQPCVARRVRPPPDTAQRVQGEELFPPIQVNVACVFPLPPSLPSRFSLSLSLFLHPFILEGRMSRARETFVRVSGRPASTPFPSPRPSPWVFTDRFFPFPLAFEQMRGLEARVREVPVRGLQAEVRRGEEVSRSRAEAIQNVHKNNTEKRKKSWLREYLPISHDWRWQHHSPTTIDLPLKRESERVHRRRQKTHAVRERQG